jgi:hypothetical protein
MTLRMRRLMFDLWGDLKSMYFWGREQTSTRWLALVSAIATLVVLLLGGLVALLRIDGIIGDDSENWFSIGRDGSIVETLGYIEFALAAVLLFMVFKRTGRQIMLALALLVGYLMLDDMFMIHDQARLWIGNSIGYESAFFKREDFGELLFALFALALAVSGFALIVRRTTRNDIALSLPVILSVGLFLSTAVMLDQIHQIISNLYPFGLVADRLSILLEDGGELVAQGLTLLASWTLYLKVCSFRNAVDVKLPVPRAIAAE